MSHTLNCDFLLGSEKDQRYWWPLIFEAMHWQSYAFALPDGVKGTGHYLSFAAANPVDFRDVTSPLRTLWDDIYRNAETNVFGVGFYSSQEDATIDISVGWEEDGQDMRLGMLFAGAEVMYIGVSEVRMRLRKWLECMKAVYETCLPQVGEVYWTYAGVSFAPWASFRAFPRQGSSERPALEPPDKQVFAHSLADGKKLYVVDPVPVPERGGWEFVSLLE
jgi:hypothetical protein